MPEHRNLARGENEWAATYGNLGMAAPARLMQLPIAVLDPWEDTDGGAQPFEPYTPAMLADLADNIGRNGIIQPINVRPRPNGRFQIIAGHNRVSASKLAGLTVIPALVQDLNDDQAAIMMIDSNLKTRQHILPSERARAYQKRMEHLQKLRAKNGTRQGGGPLVHHAPEGQLSAPYEDTESGGPLVHLSAEGQPSEFCGDQGYGGPMVHHTEKGKSRDIVALETGVNARQIQRYLRLNDLHPHLLKMVDNGSLDKEQQDKNVLTMALRAGVELSYIPMEQQDLLLQFMLEYQCKAPSMSQAEQLRALAVAQKLDEATIRSVMVKTKTPKAQIVNLPAGRISSFFPPNTPPEQMEAEIYEALLAYRKNNHSPASA